MLLGDPLPPALAAYWDAIDDRRFADAAACFGRHARYAGPVAGAIETDPRHVTVGSAAILQRFEERGPKPWCHVPLLCVADGRTALVEGVLHDPTETPTSTYLCTTVVDDDGSIDRFLSFACPGARDPIPSDMASDTEPADAAHVVHEYFDALDGGRFADAAACFSDDVLYSHPPYQHTGIDDPDRIEFRGRSALEAAFRTRGRTSFDHEVLVSIQRGPHCIFEGAVNNLPHGGTGSFISSLSLAGDGTIRRYVSFYCEPGVPFP